MSMAGKQEDVDYQIYADLPPSLRRKLGRHLDPVASSSSAKPTTSSASAAVATDISGLVPVVAHPSIPTKLAHPRLPLVNPDKESDRRKKQKEDARAERQRRKIAERRRRSGRMVREDLSKAQLKAMHDRPLARGSLSYKLMEPLHHLWLGYMSELLGLPLRHSALPQQQQHQHGSSNAATTSMLLPTQVSAAGSEFEAVPIEREIHVDVQSAADNGYHQSTLQAWQAKLVKADFTGSKLEVKVARHPSLVGLAGIVVQETEGTFRIVTPKNKIKVIPKENVSFTFALPLSTKATEQEKDLVFELHGSNFAFRSADRSSKKFKAKGGKGLDF